MLTPVLKGQKATRHSDGTTMQGSQGRKAEHVRREKGCREGMLRGRGRGGRCAEKDNGVHRKRSWTAKPPEREVRPQKAAHPILEITFRNIQT